MMAFTDDDLQRLKEHYPCGMCPENDKYIPALIARLEAAESALMAYVEASKPHHYSDLMDPRDIQHFEKEAPRERFLKWQKASGKGE